jgi:mannose-6-phosphate isomerase-like protein (cupin superfamily)
MNRLFRIPPPLRVPDGTLVSPFLNARDSTSRLPFDLLTGFSLAAGTIEPGSQSKIHVMPFVTQVTFVRRGTLTARMRARTADEAYALSVQHDEAIVTEPGTFLQLVNDTREPCDVLYIVSPAYVFEFVDGRVVYDDSVVLDESWTELEAAQWLPLRALPTPEQRQQAESRLAAKSRGAGKRFDDR